MPVTERGRGALTVRVEVDAPLGAVFAAATDWARQSEWIVLTRVWVVRGDGASPGSVVAAFTGIGRVGFLDTMEIVRWDPPHQVDVVHVGHLVRGPGSFAFQELSDRRAVMLWQEWLHLPLGWLGRLAWPLVRTVAAIGLRRSLRTFARSLAAGTGQGHPPGSASADRETT